ncbi:hypothetical protein SK066_02545 [Paenibacillus hunanensis]|uniref:hypothetical protein n=1 Tax=Paenibacillus hunanensis TaxID=539262 RepID=UPI002A6A3099|nr:hypothetical protein [Paenibacillus hunanensis]WPP41863.1 hypothetical protein SK066_02545 [Paenibacillus hunanensis]
MNAQHGTDKRLCLIKGADRRLPVIQRNDTNCMKSYTVWIKQVVSFPAPERAG